jgi:hypothetical protein
MHTAGLGPITRPIWKTSRNNTIIKKKSAQLSCVLYVNDQTNCRISELEILRVKYC